MRTRRHNDITGFSVIGQAMLTKIFDQFFIIEISQIIKRAHIVFSKRQHHAKADIFKSPQIISHLQLIQSGINPVSLTCHIFSRTILQFSRDIFIKSLNIGQFIN